jgi:dihydrolipoamide dehydrogenase
MVVGEFTTEIDVLVIGAGPGGYVAAIRAAQLGKNVTIVDVDELGGVCLNRGCIPSKALISAAHNYEAMKDSESNNMGIVAESVKINFEKVQEWKQGIVKKLTGGVESLLKGNKIDIVKGEALFVSENEVRVIDGYDVNRFKFEHCIIATGSRPIELKPFPYGGRILSSTEALELKEIPKSMVVIGGGYIGIELGQTFAKFGTQVTILEGEKQILPGFEKQLTQMVSKNLKKSNVEIVTQAMAQSAEQTDKDVTVTYKAKDEEKQVKAEYLLVTVGRKPNTDELGLEAAGVKIGERGLIEVDHQCRSSVDNIYAIGDIVDGPALAHKATYEGKVAAEVIAGHPSVVDYKVIPSVVFSEPEIASVGLNESEAKDEGYSVSAGKFPYGANGRALSLNATDGFVKVVADKENGLVLGAQIVGIEASNLIAEIALAIEMGATLEDIALTIHAHPTLGEISMEAAEAALGQAIHSMNK